MNTKLIDIEAEAKTYEGCDIGVRSAHITTLWATVNTLKAIIPLANMLDGLVYDLHYDNGIAIYDELEKHVDGLSDSLGDFELVANELSGLIEAIKNSGK